MALKELTGEERILRALQVKQADRVPHFEWYIDRKVIDAISPGSNYEQFCYKQDIDAICIDCDFEKKILDNGLIQDEWGMLKKDTGESHAFPVDGPIRTLKDAQDYIPPDPLISLEGMLL